MSDSIYHSYTDKKTIKYDRLADGWPVGAIDSILGASMIDTEWKPSEHGFPILANLKGETFKAYSPGKVPPQPYTLSYYLALVKARQSRNEAYWRLLAEHPVYSKLFAFSDLFEDMGTPPKESETVEFENLEWMGKRIYKGQETVSVGGEVCDEKEFTTEVYHVERVGTLHTKIQRDLFRSGPHKIKYRYAIESYPYWATTPHTPWRLDRVDFNENWEDVEDMQKVINLEVQTFSWNIQKPTKLSENMEAESKVHYVMISSPQNNYLYYMWDIPLTADISNQPMSNESFYGLAAIADVPIEELNGTASPGKYRNMKFNCSLSHQDGQLQFKIENSVHPQQVDNALLWFVIEEVVGFPPEGTPAFLRSAYRLPVIGIEHYWEESYFAYKKYCFDQATKEYENFSRRAKERGIPIPKPDPVSDASFADYVVRVIREVG